jgi:hypothetical protein
MSRAMNLTLPPEEVTAKCLAAGVEISAIEPLPTGGTHLVCVTGDGAATMLRKFKGSVLDGRIKRFPFYVAPNGR